MNGYSDYRYRILEQLRKDIDKIASDIFYEVHNSGEVLDSSTYDSIYDFLYRKGVFIWKSTDEMFNIEINESDRELINQYINYLFKRKVPKYIIDLYNEKGLELKIEHF